MLTLILADAELERIPTKLTGHAQVVQSARRAGVPAPKMLLDSSLHYAALRQAPEGERRGRPDLVHFFLLTALESIANKDGALQVLVHTRNDELIRVRPETRLIRNYDRFCGLMQKLFENHEVGQPTPLLTLESKRSLASILDEVAADRVVVLHPSGTPGGAREIFSLGDAQENVVCIIGGFPSGDYRSPLPQNAERRSIYPEPLTVWTVAAELLAHYPGRKDTNRPR